MATVTEIRAEIQSLEDELCSVQFLVDSLSDEIEVLRGSLREAEERERQEAGRTEFGFRPEMYVPLDRGVVCG